MIDQIFKMLFNKSYNETTGYKDVFQFRLRVINECDLLNSLVSESQDGNRDLKFKSERLARKGHVAFNHCLVQYVHEVIGKSAENNSRSEQEEQFFQLFTGSAEWNALIQGEFAHRTKLNTTSLQQINNQDSDSEEFEQDKSDEDDKKEDRFAHLIEDNKDKGDSSSSDDDLERDEDKQKTASQA